ncbi:MAG: TlpA family protein disulfide reductase [Saprospiraceae bacterium]
MRLTLVFLFLCNLICSTVWGQETMEELPITSETIFEDENGNSISFETFIELTSGTGYVIEPTLEDGTLKSLKIIKSALAPATTKSNEFANPAELIDRAPPVFEATDLAGNYYHSNDLQGKVVVLKFWFIACPPCIEEIPKLNKVVEKYTTGEVVFLAAALDGKAALKQFLQKQNFDYQILPEARDFAHSFNVLGYPTHVVINRLGKVEAVFAGVNYEIEAKLTQAIESGLRRVANPETNSKLGEAAVENPVEEEIQVNPNSVIKDKTGKRVDFGKFVEMMNTQAYELLNRKDESGARYILIQPIAAPEKGE